ncbi:NLR family CARD domain-containing protein 3-like [Salvelinus alpinus]|uniref:NLR family CARD domain-containing protein 3-like n=1 Tax=Salvelinus alpinus TaxID=8036 RepID=UPI0039FB9001
MGRRKKKRGQCSKMSLSGEREEGGPASKMHLSGGHDTKAKSPIKQERPASPVPSCVSMKSDRSMRLPIYFGEGDFSTDQRNRQERSESEILSGQSSQSHQTDLDSIFSLLEENILTFVKNELKMFKRILSPELPEGFESQKQDKEVVDAEDEKQESSAREGALKITLHVLRKMNQKELADTLEKYSDDPAVICQRELKSNLKKKFQCVFEGIAKQGNPTLLNKIYTELYIMLTKGVGKEETGPHWNKESILSLGKLAFQQLVNGNLIFYEEDLKEAGIDVNEASVYSGLCTQIFKEECGLYQDKVYCFVHLSIQEFLAAVYVFLSFINNNENLMDEPQSTSRNFSVSFRQRRKVTVYKSAVDKALQSETGNLDLFLRFLLGLSLESNQKHLQGLLTKTRSSSQSHEETVKYIKEKIRENPSPERCINLFHCLNELNDHSLVEEIQRYLRLGSLSEEELSPAQWSALVFVLLTSEKELDVFDLKKYSRSEEGLLRLLPVVKASRVVLLSGCGVTEEGCASLVSALRSNPSHLRELDLSNNDLKDSGVKLLSAGLGNPHCKLETLRLSRCLVTEEGCASLVSALRSNPSHLRELDLSYNHPGDSGVRLLSAGLEDPHCRLEKLNVEHGGEHTMKPGLRKYVCDLTLDLNTVDRLLSLSEENRKVTCRTEKQPYPDHPERFEDCGQVHFG